MEKKKFAEVLGDLVFKPAEKPTLVPLSDKRPAMNVLKLILGRFSVQL